MGHPPRVLFSFVTLAALPAPALAQDPATSGRFWSDVDARGASRGASS